MTEAHSFKKKYKLWLCTSSQEVVHSHELQSDCAWTLQTVQIFEVHNIGSSPDPVGSKLYISRAVILVLKMTCRLRNSDAGKQKKKLF